MDKELLRRLGKKDHTLFVEQAQGYLAHLVRCNKTVPEEVQGRELCEVRQALHPDRFFFVLDCKTATVKDNKIYILLCN